MSKEVKPDQVMSYLNELFSAFDTLVDTYKIYKVGWRVALWCSRNLLPIIALRLICRMHKPFYH